MYLWGGSRIYRVSAPPEIFRVVSSISLDLIIVFLGWPPVVAEAFGLQKEGASLFSWFLVVGF
jgi:hypothetical protein